MTIRSRPAGTVVRLVVRLVVRVVALAPGLGAAIASRGHAQALPPLDEYHIRAYGPANGLPSANVRGLSQGADGYIYVATGRGLTRFDGHRFRPVPLPGTRANAIEAMHADAFGRLWIYTTGNDLNGYYRDGRFRPAAPSTAVSWGVESASDSSAWFGGPGGLLRFTPADSLRPARYTTADGLPNDTVLGPFEIASGERIAVGLNRLARIEADSTVRGGHRITPFGPTYRFAGNARADANGLWLTVRETPDSVAVLRYHAGRFTRYGTVDGAPFLPFEWFEWRDDPITPSIRAGRWPLRFGAGAGHFARAALRARDGALWLAVGDQHDERDELVRLRDGRRDTIPLRPYADFQTINHVLEDHEGSVWIGTDQALFHLAPRRVAALGRRHGLAEQFTVPVIQTRDKALWVGTWGGGLHRFADGRLTHRYSEANGLPDDNVRALYEAEDGTLWVGLRYGFAAIRDGRIVAAERSEHVRAFAETRDGGRTTLWIGTAHRLLARTPRGVETHRPDHWRSRSIWALHSARDGSLWIGSERGLFRLAGDSLRELGPADGLRGPFVASIAEEADGTLWFGTYEHGLHRYRGGRLVALTTHEGLVHDGVWRVLPDERGGVWMSSDAGIFRVEHARLHEVADAIERGERPPRRLAPIVFREAEGMPSRESNRASPGGWRLDDGRLVFNNLAGVVVIDPGRVAASLAPARTVVLDVTADGRPVALDQPGTPRLPPGTRQLAFEFAALSYVAPDQNRYRYRLEGYDADWVHGGTERLARYTNLPPGRYTFHVQGGSAASAWSEAASVRVTLAPFIWQTWWFRLSALAVLAALGVAAYRYRVGQLMEMERLRVRIASDLHDDVGSNLSSIALLSEMLQADPRLGGLERRQLQRINHAAEETIGALRDIIWLVGPEHDDLTDLVRRMRNVAADVLSGTAYRFDAAEPAGRRRLDMAFMRNVLLIYKEALHNVHKHARAREVVIAVAADDGRFVLRIQDDGVGFDEACIRTGHGLGNMRRRAHESGGRLEIASAGAGGTCITFSAPLAESRDGYAAPRGRGLGASPPGSDGVNT